jgi:hypothetical protein
MAGSGFASWQISLFVQRLEKDGIKKPVDWTDDQAIELAEAVDPPDAPPKPVKKIIGLKPENYKYLQVDHQVISTFDRKPPKYDAEQVDALREIAAAIKIKHLSQ